MIAPANNGYLTNTADLAPEIGFVAFGQSRTTEGGVPQVIVAHGVRTSGAERHRPSGPGRVGRRVGGGLCAACFTGDHPIPIDPQPGIGTVLDPVPPHVEVRT
jgi:hypothetical protein